MAEDDLDSTTVLQGPIEKSSVNLLLQRCKGKIPWVPAVTFIISRNSS